MAEVWRIVPSLPSVLVSSDGRVMVKPYQKAMPHGGMRHYGGEPKFGVWNKADGRFITVLKGKTYKVHQLVCEAFNGPKPFDKAVVMHLDENAANNRPENLAWGTQKENLNAPGFKKFKETKSHEAGIVEADNPKGVTFHKASKKFAAYAMRDGQPRHIGLFRTQAEAALAVAHAAEGEAP